MGFRTTPQGQRNNDYTIMKKEENYLKRLLSLPRESNEIKIMVLSTPRTGSSYFISQLGKKLNLEYQPTELLSSVRIPKYLNDNDITIEEFLDKVIRTKTFLTKCHIHHYRYWLELGYDITRYFDYIVYIERKDKFAQGRSRAISDRSKFWITEHSCGWGAEEAMKENGIEYSIPSEIEINKKIGLTSDDINNIPLYDMKIFFEDIIDDSKIDDIVSRVIKESQSKRRPA